MTNNNHEFNTLKATVAASNPAPAQTSASNPAETAGVVAMSRKRKAIKQTQPLFTPESYLERLKQVRTAVMLAGFLEKLILPSYHRGEIPRQVRRIEKALRNGECLPEIVVSERLDPRGGKPAYAIVDGHQRVTAAKKLGFPLSATVINFGSESDERRHFIALQSCAPLRPSSK